MDSETIKQLMEEEEAFRPIVKKGLEIIKSYGPEISDLFEGIALGIVDIKIKTVKKFEASGFSREDAIALCMNEWHSFSRNLRNMNNPKK